MPTTATGKATDFITFTRASNATVTDSDGKIKWAPHNLLTNSESFDASAWTKFQATVSANTTAAPNSTTTADTIVPAAATQPHSVYSGVVSAASLTYGAFVKANGYTKVALRESATSGTGAAFDLSGSGSVIGVYNAGASTASNASIAALASGWFYISCTVTFASASSHSLGVSVLSPSYTSGDLYASWLANGTDGIYVWGAHLYRSDLGGMQANTSAYPMYNPSTPKNLLGYSEDFSNAAWTKNAIAAFGSGSVSNAVLAPNGIQTADKIVETATSDVHVAYFSATGITSGTSYTLSVYAKADTRSYVMLRAGGGGFTTAPSVKAYLSGAGTVSTLEGAVTSSSITAVGDGWYRVSMTFTTVSASGNLPQFGPHNGGATLTYTGDGTSGIYLWGAQLSDSASLDAYVPSFGAAPSAAAYHGPRLDYDPVTLACKGLLVEEQRVNLVQHSAAFDNAPWSPNNVTISANSVVSPDGTLTAEKLVENTATSLHQVGQSPSITSGATYTFSCFLKAAERSWAVVQLHSSIWAYVNLSTGAIGTTSGSPTVNVVNVGSEWYRVSVTSAVVAATASNSIYIASANGTVSYLGDGTSGLYVWGAQLEAGSFATSYIPTAAATVTRNADVASVGVSQFPYSGTEGTLVANFVPTLTVTDNIRGASLSDGTNRSIDIYTASGQWLTYNGATNVSPGSNTATVGANVKFAAAYKSGDYAAAMNGGTVGTANTAAVATATKLSLGASITNATFLNGHIRQITYLPRRLTNAELQSRTA